MEIGAHDGRSEHSDTSDVIKSLSQNFSPEALQSALKLAMAMKNAPQEEYDSLMRLISQPNEAPDSEEKPSVEAADGCENDNSLEKLQHLPELSDQVEKNNIERDHVVSNGLGEGKDSHIADENAASGNNSYEIEGGSVFTSKDDERFSEVSDEEDKIKDQFRSEADGNIDDCVTTVAVDDVNAAVDGKEDSKNDFVTDEKSAHQLDDTTSDNSVCSVDISNVTPIGEKKLSEFPYKDESLANTLSTTGVNSVSSFPEYANSSEDEKLPELLQGKAEDCFSEIEDVDGKEPVRVVSVESETNKASVEEGTPSMYHVSSVPQSLATDVLESDESKVDDADSSSSDEDEMASSSHSVVTSSESDLSEAVTPSESLAEQSEKLKGNVRQLAEGTQLSLLMTGSKDDDVAVTDDEMVPEDVCKEHSYVTAPVLERLSSLSSTGTQTSLENLSLVKDQVLSTHGNLDSILGGKECHASKLPFYYQPQIVVHEEKPVLVLQPMPSAASLSNGNAGVPGLEKGAFNASLPIILPLASPSIDEKTKEALFQRMNQTGTFLADQGDVEEAGTKEKNHLSGVLSTEISSVSQLNGEHSNKIPAAEKYGEHKDGGKTEGLPEWVASSELDKAFTAAAEEMPPTTEQEKPAILASPRVSFPSTNPFAKDLVVQQSGHHDVEAESPLNPSRGEAPLYSLFGPPSSPTVLQGARPKEFRAYQDPGIGGSGTNPFTPDPPKSTRQRRRHEQKLPSSTEVVVAAEVHSSVGHLGGINGSPRRRLSSESMVTLIETSYPDTSAGCAEPLGINETTNATKNPHPQQERNENGHGMPKPQKTLQKSGEIHLDTKKPEAKVPGSVAPHWVPDFACLNCTGCKVKFTLFIRKHHCRGCGKIFCNTCCSQLARFPYLEFKIGRVCYLCTAAIKQATKQKKLQKQLVSNAQESRRMPEKPLNSPASIQNPKGLPQRIAVTNANAQGNSSSAPHTSVLPGEVVAANMQPQRNSPSLPLAQGLRTSTPSSVPVPQGSVSNQPLQYQPLTWPPVSSGRVQNTATPLQPVAPSNNPSQGSQSLTRPAQPAKQYMWVPASHVQQPAVPVVYMNPVAPNLPGRPMLMTYPPGQQFIPQQAPVVLLPNQLPSTSSLVQATEAPKTSSGSLKGTVPVSNRPPSGTVTTFSVLPQHVGQAAVLGHNTGSVKTTTTTTTTSTIATTVINQVSSTSSSAPSSQIQPPSFQSLQQTIPEPSEEALTSNHNLPSTSVLDQTPSHAVTTASPSQRESPSVASSSSGDHQSQESLTGSQRSRQSEGSVLVSDETDPNTKDTQLPLRRAGRTITWRHRTQGKSKLREKKKSIAKNLKELPDGITVQATADLFVHVKKMKLKEGNKDISVWCYLSEGLGKFNHLEVVVLLEIRKKEEIFPEEVLRVYRGILHLASKMDHRFYHGNYLSSNNQFLDGPDDAGFILVSSELKPKPQGLKGTKTPFLYGILVKRSELSAAMFTPSRLLLRLGNQMNSFPFPVWNNRDRRPILLGNQHEDRFFHTVSAMNKYLKNSVPEAMIPGLYVIQERNKIVLQVPKSEQSAVVGLLDRLIKKENQTATLPLLADIPPYVDSCKVVVCGENGKKTVKSFGNANDDSVVGLGFVLLHLGVDASSPLSFGGELLDDGVLIFFSKSHTLKLRQSLQGKTNCYFFLGDKFDIAHFELRWTADANYHVLPSSLQNSEPHPAETTTEDTTPKEPGAGSFPGHATIGVHYSGFGNEVEILRQVFDDYGKILQVLEGDIRRACTEPLMKHSKKMKAGDIEDLQLRVVLRPSYKKWSVGPSDLPTALIRSLQMVLHTVKVPMVFEGELVMSFYVSVLKE